MKVFKFGGASVNSVERIKNVATIMKQYQVQPLMVIISAMGKTTNALEKVVEAFFDGKQEEALKLFDLVKQNHLTTTKYLLVTTYSQTLEQLVNFFTEAEWLLHDKPVREYDYYYDQVVCIGELLSTCIMSAYLNEVGIVNELLDVRDILRTDNVFRDAGVDWQLTEKLMAERLSLLTNNELVNNRSTKIYITQGFIGSTDANESTTLGREGSDYSAAIFANLLNAESLTIWKDVEGVMSADPKTFPDAQFISNLSYNEVIEMAYYGAQVIHPKTIKPLQNKSIQLHVRSFLNPDVEGTVISRKNVKNLPPIKVVKQSQVMVHLHSQDFSFVGEQPISQLYKIFGTLHIKPNLLQTGAISIQLCIDEHPEKIDQLAASASELFDVQLEKGLTLLTIRHFRDDLLENMIAGKEVVLMQQTKETVQVLYR
jgi:aspartate kinase